MRRCERWGSARVSWEGRGTSWAPRPGPGRFSLDIRRNDEVTSLSTELTFYRETFISGITKFCNFSFEPIGTSCDGQEERHKISIGFLNAKSQPQSVNWILVLGVRTPHAESVGSEIKARTTFISDLQTFLNQSSYKRAKGDLISFGKMP